MRISDSDLRALNSKGFFNRYGDAQPTFTTNNIGMPAGILSALSPKVVENILNYRTGDEALGKREKVLDWWAEAYYSPMAEKTGQTTPYSDYGMPLLAGLNINFNQVGHYRFTSKFQSGNLMSEQVGKARIHYNTMLLNATMDAIAVELNRTAFNGYIENSGKAFICYGLLNNPELSNYEEAQKQFEAMTWQEIMAFFGKALSKLTKQSGNNINGNSKIRVVISASAFAKLQTSYTDLGVSVYKTILETYPNMYFVSAIELDNANNNQNVIYFIGENMAGGIEETTKLGYSELALMGNVVNTDYGFSQAVSAGTCGALVLKPLFVVRYTNI